MNIFEFVALVWVFNFAFIFWIRGDENEMARL